MENKTDIKSLVEHHFHNSKKVKLLKLIVEVAFVISHCDPGELCVLQCAP